VRVLVATAARRPEPGRPVPRPLPARRGDRPPARTGRRRGTAGAVVDAGDRRTAGHARRAAGAARRGAAGSRARRRAARHRARARRRRAVRAPVRLPQRRRHPPPRQRRPRARAGRRAGALGAGAGPPRRGAPLVEPPAGARSRTPTGRSCPAPCACPTASRSTCSATTCRTRASWTSSARRSRTTARGAALSRLLPGVPARPLLVYLRDQRRRTGVGVAVAALRGAAWAPSRWT
jgi:hypothetical protein